LGIKNVGEIDVYRMDMKSWHTKSRDWKISWPQLDPDWCPDGRRFCRPNRDVKSPQRS